MYILTYQNIKKVKKKFRVQRALNIRRKRKSSSNCDFLIYCILPIDCALCQASVSDFTAKLRRPEKKRKRRRVVLVKKESSGNSSMVD